jgi:hypothetical protein
MSQAGKTQEKEQELHLTLISESNCNTVLLLSSLEGRVLVWLWLLLQMATA